MLLVSYMPLAASGGVEQPKRKLRQHEAQAGKGVEPDPEEEQYWRYEIPHTIS